jgi:hypothetical protein
MLGTINVGTAGETPTEGGGRLVPEVPESARVLALAGVTVALSVIGLAYFFMKYGGDYGFADEEE